MSLTRLFILAVLAFHAGNLLHHWHYRPFFQLHRTQAVVKVLSREFPFSFPDGNLDHFWPFKDYGSLILSKPGAVARYFTHNTRPDILVGKRGRPTFVFIRQEIPYQYAMTAREMEQHYLGQVRPWLQRLTDHGIASLILPMPTKIATERDRLRYLPEPDAWRVENRDRPVTAHAYIDAIENSLPRATINVQKAYADWKRTGSSDPLFLPGDTHWSALGVAIAARAAIEKLRQNGWDLKAPRVERTDYRSPERAISGDLLAGLLIPKGILERLPEFQWSENFYRLAEVTDHCPLRGGRIVLVGTSFSAQRNDTPYGFGPQLAHALHCELIDLNIADGGRALSTLKRMRDQGVTLASQDLVILEFAIRQGWNADEVLPDLKISGEDRNLSQR